jgi:hypothetical protein
MVVPRLEKVRVRKNQGQMPTGCQFIQLSRVVEADHNTLCEVIWSRSIANINMEATFWDSTKVRDEDLDEFEIPKNRVGCS